MSYVVDTDVLSRTSPSTAQSIPGLREWLARNSRAAASLGGLAHRDRLRHRSGDDIAVRAGQLLARARASGAKASAEDALIAATADLGAMTVITANARHFAPMRVRYADPLAGLPPDAGP